MRNAIPRYLGRCPMPGCRNRADWHVDQLATHGMEWEVCGEHAAQLVRAGGTAHRYRLPRPRRRFLRA